MGISVDEIQRMIARPLMPVGVDHIQLRSLLLGLPLIARPLMLVGVDHHEIRGLHWQLSPDCPTFDARRR